MTDQQRAHLIEEARAATARAFLTSPGGTAYGASVLTLAGKVYSAGQYSSWNHVTNIHAEQAALLLATMSDDSDVIALALASTGGEPVARPCGVCRQVMVEHAKRTGRDFEVLMAHRTELGFERVSVSGLLPLSWTAGSQTSTLVSAQELKYRDANLTEGQLLSGPLRVGDHVVLSDGTVAMVWDGCFDEDRALVKLKYTAAGEHGRRKVAHSFTEPMTYRAELFEMGWARQTRAGAFAAVIGSDDVSRHYPAPILEQLGDKPPGPIMNILRRAGIDVGAIRVSGSRSLGLHHEHSDWDLLVPIAPDKLPGVRTELLKAVEERALEIPTTSGTWKLLDRLFPGGHESLLAEHRFIETVQSDGSSVALMFVPPTSSWPLFDSLCEPLGRGCFHGIVIDATHAAYKRSLYRLRTESMGELEVVCYHKLANLLREGDRVSVRGWLTTCGKARRLIQMLVVPDNIVWHSKGGS